MLYHFDFNRRRNARESFSQLDVPAALRSEILSNVHDHIARAHFGLNKTFSKLKQRYWWKGMFKDVEHWVKSCVECSMRKSPRNSKKAPLLPIPVEGAFDRVAVDVLGPFPPSSKGSRYIVVFSDYLTRWVDANRMKPFVDPNLRPINPPPFDDRAEPYLDESDIPKDCFEPNNSVHAEENLLDSGLNPVDKQALVTQQSHEEKESNKESDQEKTNNQLQNEKEPTPEAIVIDNKTVFSAEKILKHRKRNRKVEYLVKWLNFPKSQSSWEPEENILDKRLIDNYLRSPK